MAGWPVTLAVSSVEVPDNGLADDLAHGVGPPTDECRNADDVPERFPLGIEPFLFSLLRIGKFHRSDTGISHYG